MKQNEYNVIYTQKVITKFVFSGFLKNHQVKSMRWVRHSVPVIKYLCPYQYSEKKQALQVIMNLSNW